MIEKAPPAAGEHLGDSAADRSADAGDRLDGLAPALLGDRAEIGVQRAKQIGGSAVGGDAKQVGSLRCENIGGLTKLVGDLIVRFGEIVLTRAPSIEGIRRPERARLLSDAV